LLLACQWHRLPECDDHLQNLSGIALARGRAFRCFRGSAHDIRDGFIHFSTAGQVAETAAKHFAGQHDLLLVRVESEKLGDRLKWEPSRGGALFPHLYGDLAAAEVSGVDPLPLGPDGKHRFP